MRLKNIIAILVLCVYSVAFGHQVIPHQHNQQSNAVACLQDQNPDHGHISHFNHYDDGLMDFLACIFSHTHQSDDCDVKTVRITTEENQVSLAVTIAVFGYAAVFLASAGENQEIGVPASINLQGTLLAHELSLRGPPYFN